MKETDRNPRNQTSESSPNKITRRGFLALGSLPLISTSLTHSVTRKSSPTQESSLTQESSPTQESSTQRSYRLVGEVFEPGTQETVVEDDYAYIATTRALVTVDLSDPTNPSVEGYALSQGYENKDVKVDGDIAGVADDSRSVGGVTFFDVSDSSKPAPVSFYDAVGPVHNLFIKDGYAYVCVNRSITESKMDIVDVRSPSNPRKVGEWVLREHHPDLASGRRSPIHDIYVQGEYAYLCYWDSGVVVTDVSDPENPREVGHFGATDDASEEFGGRKFWLKYLNAPGNAHYVQPTPDGNHVLVGAETFPYNTEERGGPYGGIEIYDMSEVLDSGTSDPTKPVPVGRIRAPSNDETDQEDGLRTSHNFDVTDSMLFSSFYQGGVRAYDISSRSNPKEVDSYSPPGTNFWSAVNLGKQDGSYYTVAGDIGDGVKVLELSK